jgi:hypothetical protein
LPNIDSGELDCRNTLVVVARGQGRQVIVALRHRPLALWRQPGAGWLVRLDRVSSRQRVNLDGATRHNRNPQLTPDEEPHAEKRLIANSRHQYGSPTKVPCDLRRIDVKLPNRAVSEHRTAARLAFQAEYGDYFVRQSQGSRKARINYRVHI